MSEPSRVLSGRYRVDDVIGTGGMATVYRGYDLKLGRTVAVKILNKDLARDSTFRTRFRMEAQAASRMANQSIVRVFDAGEDTENDVAVPYIIMELVTGRTLKQHAAEGRLTTSDALRYVDGILEALEYSHRAGVIHRDIKPGNVMITEDGRVKVMDFGIARAVSDSSSTVAETTSIIGTAAYFSPEQAKGEPVDARTDLYSTGIVLYELLTGRQPFRGDSPVAVAYQHVSETPVPPSEVDQAVPRALDEVVLRALAKDPYNRYPDAATFRAALAGAADGRTPSKRHLENLTNELYGANPRAAAETARSLRQLSTDTTMTRTQQGPPVAWIWAGVAVVAVLVVSVVFWAVSFGKPSPTATPTGLTVPNVVTMEFDQATHELTEKGLRFKKTEEASEDVAAGSVIRTDPAPGTPIEPASSVTLVVSTGAATVEVPALVDQTSAAQALQAAGLQLGAVNAQNDPSRAKGTVISSEPAAGEKVAPGTTVRLLVASGKVTVVNYKGWSLEAARETLEGPEFELTVNATPDPSCTGGTVQSQVQIGDVDIHSTVDLTYCAG
ncbi:MULTISPECIES: Stk1 family PASTA domain-containing Ser/Thr kinase [Microbacterium]|uniref:Stk1 family PASTA domain-containing Ser/Thr kinase n=1 Tax=Microbacterium TaxID=33882 RepID=UPI0027E08258|nr:Stk1 family PASTA domain-containing Ser/Thr kinase [Microbacterium nymphoidis]